VKPSVLNLWASEYRPTNTIATDTPTTSTNSFTRFLNEQDLILDAQELKDEYERYITSPLVPGVTDPIAWWLKGSQQRQYPNLSRMALDILLIPTMSAAPERLFLGAKIVITDRKNRLGIESINALLCLRSWFKVLDMESTILDLDITITEMEDQAEKDIVEVVDKLIQDGIQAGLD
jgi:hypothetical protein